MNIHESINALDYGVVILYLVVLLSIGFWVSYRRKESEDLFLAGRSLGWMNIGLSIWGTNISPSMMIASCGVAYSSGIVMGNSSWLAWLFLVLLAMVFIPHYLNTKICTMPEFLKLRYGEGCRAFLSYYALVSTLVLWLGGTTLAGGELLSQITGWPLWVCIVALAGIATSFTMAGGLAAVVVTDSFQVVLMIVASAVLAIVSIHKVGGLGALIDGVPDDYWVLFKPASDKDWPWHAVLFGYLTSAIWFWCTDQTVVQRVLGGRNIEQGQLGAVFTGFLKILDPLIFFIPGIACFILFPGLEDQDTAYMKMVTTCLPHGMIGLIVAVLIAALISTVDSGLNSFSTVFTLEIYKKHISPDATPRETRLTGQIVTLVAGVISVVLSLTLSLVEMDLFSLLGSIIGFLAPVMSTVFLLGVLWKRATSTAAFVTLTVGGTASLIFGIIYLYRWEEVFGAGAHKPHFMWLSFLIWCVLMAFMIILSLATRKSPEEQDMPTLLETLRQGGKATHKVWAMWGVLAVIMAAIYVIFNDWSWLTKVFRQG